MKLALRLVLGAFIGFTELGISQNGMHKKPITEDQAHKIVTEKVGVGQVVFVERKGDDSGTAYEIYVARGDSLIKAIVNGHSGLLDTLIINPEDGRTKMQARILAMTRAENAALAAVPGEITRWKLRQHDDTWFYRFIIETQDRKLKEVYVDANNFKVTKVKQHKLGK
jgi:uncharacterized membrane protein YkoI